MAVVHPELLHQGSLEDVQLSQLDVQRVNCTRMPCLLATKRGTSQHQVDLVMEFQNLFATQRLNSGMKTILTL